MGDGIEKKRDQIKILDSVRAFATIAVFLFHLGYLFITGYPEHTFFNWQRLVYFGGTVGVSVFFVLSGFLLFYQLCKNDEPLDKKAIWKYTKKRLLRILPLYYFSILVITLILKPDVFLNIPGLKSIIYNMLFIREIKSSSGGGILTINPVYWSLVVEMHFYILLPVFYYFFYKYKKMVLFLAPLAFGIIYRIILVFVVKNPTMQLLRFTPADFDFFALGMLGSYLYIYKKNVIEKLGSARFQFLFVLLFFLFVRFYDLEFAPTISYVLAPILLGTITILLILSFLGDDRTVLSYVLTTRPILFIAKISFSIYVWHPVVFERVDKLLVTNHTKIILDVVATLVVSTITYYAIEAPFLRLKSKKIT